MPFLLWSYVSSKQIESYLKCRYELFWIRQDCGNAVGKPRQYDYKARVHLCLGWGDVTVLCDRWKKKTKEKKIQGSSSECNQRPTCSRLFKVWLKLIRATFIVVRFDCEKKIQRLIIRVYKQALLIKVLKQAFHGVYPAVRTCDMCSLFGFVVLGFGYCLMVS